MIPKFIFFPGPGSWAVKPRCFLNIVLFAYILSSFCSFFLFKLSLLFILQEWNPPCYNIFLPEEKRIRLEKSDEKRYSQWILKDGFKWLLNWEWRKTEYNWFYMKMIPNLLYLVSCERWSYYIHRRRPLELEGPCIMRMYGIYLKCIFPTAVKLWIYRFLSYYL